MRSFVLWHIKPGKATDELITDKKSLLRGRSIGKIELCLK